MSIPGSQAVKLMSEGQIAATVYILVLLALSLPKANLTNPRKLLNPELSNEI